MNECICPYCSWQGRWEDADYEIHQEPRGEYWGIRVSQEMHEYSCPICGDRLIALEERRIYGGI